MPFEVSGGYMKKKQAEKCLSCKKRPGNPDLNGICKECFQEMAKKVEKKNRTFGTSLGMRKLTKK